MGPPESKGDARHGFPYVRHDAAEHRKLVPHFVPSRGSAAAGRVYRLAGVTDATSSAAPRSRRAGEPASVAAAPDLLASWDAASPETGSAPTCRSPDATPGSVPNRPRADSGPSTPWRTRSVRSRR